MFFCCLDSAYILDIFLAFCLGLWDTGFYTITMTGLFLLFGYNGSEELWRSFTSAKWKAGLGLGGLCIRYLYAALNLPK
jgi:hypothetical protein